MPEINKISVLESFILKEDHKLSWLHLAEIFHIVNGTERAIKLGNIIEDLTNESIIKRLPLATWEIIDFNKTKRYFEDLDILPISQPNPTPKNHRTIKRIISIINIASKHPLWSAIIAGIILLLISHFIFGTP